MDVRRERERERENAIKNIVRAIKLARIMLQNEIVLAALPSRKIACAYEFVEVSADA